jgi:hypothetical protein
MRIRQEPVEPGILVVTDDRKGYAGLEKCGYRHFATTQLGNLSVTEECLPIIHLVFANLKSLLLGIACAVAAATYDELYSCEWLHLTCWGCVKTG